MNPAIRTPVVGLPAVLVALGVVAVDQATKATSHHQALPNPETLLGIVPTGSAAATLVATIALLVVAGGLLARQVVIGRCPSRLAAIPLAGAASNALDRVVHGAVVDWITLSDYIINLADVAILLGAAAVALSIRRHRANPSPRHAQP